MSGGKETLRQKMIGMMYLVLTALLALQVSTNILDKFESIDKSLSESALARKTQNEKQLAVITSVVNKDRRKQAFAVLDMANKVRSDAKKLCERIEEIKEKAIKASGGREGGKIVNTKDEMESLAIIMGPGESKKGEAYSLQKELNEYAKKMSTYIPKVKFEPMAVDSRDEGGNKADWVFNNFNAAPIVASLCIFSKLQNDVLNMEGTVLIQLASLIGAGDISFDQVKAQVTPEQSILAAGTKYKARLFIAASSSSIKPTMKLNGSPINVDAEGYGQIEFTAQGGTYDKDGKIEKSWTGSISIPKKEGGDTVYAVTQKYTVVKPVIQIQSASVSALYLNCGNKLSVQVPALGDTYSPSFSVTGGDAIPGQKTGEVTIVPTSALVKLDVKSSGNYIGTEEFKVRGIPLPTISVLCGGSRPCNEKEGEKDCPRSLVIKAIPDESFKNFLPEDARYKVSDYNITLARGKRPVAGPINFESDNANLTQLASQARSGDRLIVEIKGVTRRNFRNVNDKVNMGSLIYKNIPIQ
ncbi:MAG: hypothetical protein A3H98_00025 [Bacteroidetes bacterium RIFCSPLOWO2_02_FULL_36_8]|nr:MAG: hypothetical protein A3H98_00025 [Bacteroidetes bacterium RIFCSPLOWO2_02_FULL_36_8]OFY69910.1 MAG: hypothetical protein A3G23_05475 [Bacteroidetes bacterium RIFCSPLOWO2_12_FULL_37_12]